MGGHVHSCSSQATCVYLSLTSVGCHPEGVAGWSHVAPFPRNVRNPVPGREQARLGSDGLDIPPVGVRSLPPRPRGNSFPQASRSAFLSIGLCWRGMWACEAGRRFAAGPEPPRAAVLGSPPCPAALLRAPGPGPRLQASCSDVLLPAPKTRLAPSVFVFCKRV